MNATELYFWWREKVFGPHPTAYAIPPEILTGYLNEIRAARESNAGIDRKLLSLSIPIIKTRGQEIFRASQKAQK